MEWVSIDPAVIASLVGAEALYLHAITRLRRRGRRVAAWQQVAWHAGIALFALALLGPFNSAGEELLSAHMAQHLLIADLAAPLVLTGLRHPVLMLFLPRPALVALARRRRLRRVMRAIRRPLPAVAIYVCVLYGWHFAVLFEAALASDLVHALQHQTFVAASLLVWWPALEPQRARVGGELWKIGHLLGSRLAGMMLGMAFIATRAPVYVDAYGSGERLWGFSPVGDQQSAGALMLSLDVFVTMFALTFFFWRAARDHDDRERVLAEP